LGTLGGDNGDANWLNDSGEIVGDADLPGSQNHHAFLWRHGVMSDIGTLGSTSFAEAINSMGQIVGRSRIGSVTNPAQHAFLWENGGPMIDLNTLIPANSTLELEEGDDINGRGEISGLGIPVGCTSVDLCGHAYLMIPCDEGHPNVESCDYNLVDPSDAAQVRATLLAHPITPAATSDLSPARTVAQSPSLRRAITAGRPRFRFPN
jgi:probable HAF family extracellular repeat protein